MTSPLASLSRRPLRAYLLWLILATLVPGVVGASLLFVHQYQKGRAQFERNTLQTARALAYTVDSKLLQAKAIAQTLSTLDALNDADFARAHHQAREALLLAGGGMTAVVRTPAGQQLLNTGVPFGTALPVEHTAHLDKVVATGQPSVSGAFIGKLLLVPTVSVDVPVRVKGKIEYILSVGLRPAYFADMLAPGSLPEGSRAGVIAPDGTIFVRHSPTPSSDVAHITAPLQQAMSNRHEGIVSTTARDGEPMLVFFARSSVSGWHVAIGVPRSQLSQALLEPLAALILGITILFGIGLWLAWQIGGRLARSIHALRAPAEALGKGARLPSITPVYVREVGDVADAIGSAAQLLHERALALETKELELRDVHRLARFGTWHLDLSTGLFKTSASVAYIFGRTLPPFEELRGAILKEESWLMAKQYVERMQREGGTVRLQFDAMHIDGRQLCIDVRAESVYDGQGQVRSLRGTLQDVTDRVKAEQALRQADQRKNEFLAMLAHELRNPLAPIASGAQLLSRDGLDPERARQICAIIVRQTRHMAGLVDDLLDVSRVTRGRVVLARECLDMHQIVGEALEQVQHMLQQKQHQLDTDFDIVPAWVIGDHKRLVQVISNLLHNAIKFTDACGRIRVILEVSEQTIRVRISDSGIGMTADELEQAFEMFVQGERTPDRAQGGLGIGLALVRSLVELHGGCVWVHSEGPGLGSTFTVSLPRSAAPHPHGTQHGSDANAPRRLKVLIVDDNADAGEVLAMSLIAAGHEVVVECDSRTALAHAPQFAPDVCLLDIGLPEMDGHALARHLRALPATREALLVAITGYDQIRDREASRQAGFDHHLAKPIDLEKLGQILEEYAAQAVPLDA